MSSSIVYMANQFQSQRGKKTVETPEFVAGLIIGMAALLFDLYWMAAAGLGIFIYLSIRFFNEIGTRLPVETLLLLFASIQWIVGPMLYYAGAASHYKLKMYVSEEEYFYFIVPGLLCFAFGVYAFRPKNTWWILKDRMDKIYLILKTQKDLPYYLLAVGIFFSLIQSYLPPSLAFPAYVLANIKYIAVIYLLFTDSKNKRLILFAAVGFAFISSIYKAMFHDLVLWSALMAMYAALLERPSRFSKLVYLSIGLVAIFAINTVKQEFRGYVWHQGYAGNRVSLFGSLMSGRFSEESEEYILSDSNIEQFIIRINQGWIISRIMQQVPANIPHANGNTIKDAILATLVPRFLYSDKPKAGGRENYEKFTGYKLHGTSMGISLPGEGYVNFGVVGGWFFLFSIGSLFSLCLRGIYKLSARSPSLILWLPLIFLHVLKAETELVVQLNYLVKSLILTFGFLWGSRKFFGWRL